MSTPVRIVTGLIIVFFFGFVLLYVIPVHVETANYLPAFAPGSDVWPKVISLIGLLMGCLLVSRFFHTGIIKQMNDTSLKIYFAESLKSNKPEIKRVFLILVFLAIYILLIPILGLLVSSSFLLAALLIATGKKSALKFNLIMSVSLPLGLNYLFSEVTSTQFPVGSIWTLFSS